jgi:uncharacterized membrane protein
VPEHRPRRPALHAHFPRAFGNDRFGILAERFARFFGTPKFIIGQTIVVIIWIALNAAAVTLRWDPYPFILLNLAFSTQAAYAAPLILLAQTRQADRDKLAAIDFEAHRDEVSERQLSYERRVAEVIEREQALGVLVEEVARLTRELHAHAQLDGSGRGGSPT